MQHGSVIDSFKQLLLHKLEHKHVSTQTGRHYHLKQWLCTAPCSQSDWAGECFCPEAAAEPVVHCEAAAAAPAAQATPGSTGSKTVKQQAVHSKCHVFIVPHSASALLCMQAWCKTSASSTHNAPHCEKRSLLHTIGTACMHGAEEGPSSCFQRSNTQ